MLDQNENLDIGEHDMNQANQAAKVHKSERARDQLGNRKTGQQLANYDGQLACADALKAYC